MSRVGRSGMSFFTLAGPIHVVELISRAEEINFKFMPLEFPVWMCQERDMQNL